MPLSGEDLVGRVGLTGGDLAAPATVDLPQGGDQVEGQVTLDQCGYDFTTESQRVARRQVWVRQRPDVASASYSNETVAYLSPRAARLALEQFRDAVTTCPRDVFIESGVAGWPAMRFDVLEFDPAFRSVPTPGASYLTERVTARDGKSLYLSLVFQRRGEVLNGNYLISKSAPTRQMTSELMRQARLTGRRLTALR